MTSWFLLTIFSVISRAIYGVMTKVLSNKLTVSVYTQSTLLPLSAAIITLLLSPFLGGITFNFSHVNLLYFILMILSQGFGNIIYFSAIKHLTSATAQISFSSILFFNTILSLLFLNLHLSFINVIGLFLLSFGILLAISGKVEFNKRGVILMIFSAFLFSIFQLTSGVISKQINAATYLFFAYIGSALTVFVFNIKPIINDLKNITRDRSTLIIPFITAVPSLGNFFFAYFAYRLAPEPSKVAMLLTSQVVIAVLLSYIFLKETGHLFKKLAAATLVVVASIMIKG